MHQRRSPQSALRAPLYAAVLLASLDVCSKAHTPAHTMGTPVGATAGTSSVPATGGTASVPVIEPGTEPDLGAGVGGESGAAGGAPGTEPGAAGEGGGDATHTGGQDHSGTPSAGAGPGPDVEAPGPCCEASTAKGCNDAATQRCVCDKDPRCCTEAWDEVCVALVAGTSGSDCGSCTADCCSESAGPGCEDRKIQECVCALDDTCCEQQWDSSCVFLVSKTLDGARCGICK